jgi:hypothetical protein
MNVDKIDNVSIYNNIAKTDNKCSRTKPKDPFQATLDSKIRLKTAEYSTNDTIFENQSLEYLKSWLNKGEFNNPENILNSAENLLKYGI